MKTIRIVSLLVPVLFALSPLSLFALLVVPYSWFNGEYLVDWLGCGCAEGFNANDFTACFWLAVSILASVISCFLSRHLFPVKKFVRIVYIAATSAVSLMIASFLRQLMMWN